MTTFNEQEHNKIKAVTLAKDKQMNITHPYIKEYLDLIGLNKIKVTPDIIKLISVIHGILTSGLVWIDEEMVNNSVDIPKRYFPFNLYPWQKFCQVFIYGLRWKETNELVFNRYFLYMGRGAGKNGYISWNAFFMTTKYHGIMDYAIDIIATSESQAKTSFLEVNQVLDNNQDKLKIGYNYTATYIKNLATKSEICYNTSNAKTKDGKRIGCNVFDEIHAYTTYDQVKVFTSAGGKIEDYREFFISTDGENRGGVLDDMLAESEQVLSGELSPLKTGGEYSTLFPFLCYLPEKSMVDDESNWEYANPSYIYNSNLRNVMRQQYAQMQRVAQVRMEFMTKRMNCPIEDTRFSLASYEDRMATDQPFPFNELEGLESIGGLDFAELRDFCSVGVLIKNNGKRYWKHHTFIHHRALELQDINKEIIDIAKEKGLITMIYDNMIKPEHVRDWFVMIDKTYPIKEICIDVMRARTIKPMLEEVGFQVSIVRSGTYTESLLAPLIDECFIEHKFVFHDDPLMRWYCGNTYKEFQPNGNVSFKKFDYETRKTDGFFALMHAMKEDLQLTDYEVSGSDNNNKGFTMNLISY